MVEMNDQAIPVTAPALPPRKVITPNRSPSPQAHPVASGDVPTLGIPTASPPPLPPRQAAKELSPLIIGAKSPDTSPTIQLTGQRTASPAPLSSGNIVSDLHRIENDGRAAPVDVSLEVTPATPSTTRDSTGDSVHASGGDVRRAEQPQANERLSAAPTAVPTATTDPMLQAKAAPEDLSTDAATYAPASSVINKPALPPRRPSTAPLAESYTISEDKPKSQTESNGLPGGLAGGAAGLEATLGGISLPWVGVTLLLTIFAYFRLAPLWFLLAAVVGIVYYGKSGVTPVAAPTADEKAAETAYARTANPSVDWV